MVAVLAKLNPKADRWQRFLQLAVWYSNARPYEVVGISETLSPFEVFRGRKVWGFFDKSAFFDDPAPEESEIVDGVETVLSESKLVAESFEEIWKQLRARSFEALSRRVRVEDVFAEGEYVYIYIPKLLQKKSGGSLEGSVSGRARVDNHRYTIVGEWRSASCLQPQACSHKSEQIR